MSDESTPENPSAEAPTVPGPPEAEAPTVPAPSEVGAPVASGPAGIGSSTGAPAAPTSSGRGWIWGGIAAVAVVALVVGAYFVGRSSVDQGPSSLAEAAQQTAKGDLPVGHVSLGELGKALGGSNGDVLKGLDGLGGKGAGSSLLDGLLNELGKQLENGLSGKSSSGDSSTSSSQHAYFGVSTTNAPSGSGAQISAVKADSPASDAGLQAGDVITAVDAKTVTSSSSLASQVGSHSPGDVVTVTYSRNGASADARVRLGNASTPTTTTSPAI